MLSTPEGRMTMRALDLVQKMAQHTERAIDRDTITTNDTALILVEQTAATVTAVAALTEAQTTANLIGYLRYLRPSPKRDVVESEIETRLGLAATES